MKTIELISLTSTIIGLIPVLPYLVRLVKKPCAVFISFIKGFFSLMHEMIVEVATRNWFVVLLNALPWILKSGLYAVGVLTAIEIALNHGSLIQCLLCFALTAIIGQIEFYLFKKMATSYNQSLIKSKP